MMTEFEMIINILGMLVFSILLCIKVDLSPTAATNLTWTNVFTPLFVVDGLQAYFLFIVFIRLVRDKELKAAIVRLILTGVMLSLRFTFKLLLHHSVSGLTIIKFTYISLPIFFILVILLFKSCTLKKYDA